MCCALNSEDSMIHHVDYDLGRPGQDYEGLIEELKATGSWARPCQSTWLVSTAETAAQLRDRLAQHLDDTDKLMVMEVTGADWASRGIDKVVVDWLRANVA
jgi:hypothetical protein